MRKERKDPAAAFFSVTRGGWEHISFPFLLSHPPGTCFFFFLDSVPGGYARARRKGKKKPLAAGDITYISCILLPQTLDLKVISLSRGLWRRILLSVPRARWKKKRLTSPAAP